MVYNRTLHFICGVRNGMQPTLRLNGTFMRNWALWLDLTHEMNGVVDTVGPQISWHPDVSIRRLSEDDTSSRSIRGIWHGMNAQWSFDYLGASSTIQQTHHETMFEWGYMAAVTWKCTYDLSHYLSLDGADWKLHWQISCLHRATHPIGRYYK